MSRLTAVLMLLVLLLAGGSVAFLATWDMPPPSGTVEKVLADERFPH